MGSGLTDGMTKTTHEKTTLVLGGTGKTGRRVAAGLTARGVPVRLGSRSADPPFDWENEATWEPALRNVGSVYVSYQPDLAVPGADDAIGSLTEIAVAGGVGRLVLLSGRGEEGAEVSEQLVQDSGTEWTILRSTWFAQNFSEDYLLEPVLGGEVALPAGNVREPFVDVDDIAEIAVAALTEDGHLGQLYELTGPRLLTFADAVNEISKATSREIGYAQVSPEEYAAVLKAHDVPADFVWLMNYLFTTVFDGRNAHLADGVQRALGREPRDFSDYARHTAATGVWDVENTRSA